jgi:hypothetical protein
MRNECGSINSFRWNVGTWDGTGTDDDTDADDPDPRNNMKSTRSIGIVIVIVVLFTVMLLLLHLLLWLPGRTTATVIVCRRRVCGACVFGLVSFR